MNRIYGRPKEMVAVVENPDPLGIKEMTREQRQALLAEIARREGQPHLHAVD